MSTDQNPENYPFDETLHRPWLVAIWPGMGSVAMTAGTYLTASLDAVSYGDLPSDGFFDVDKVEIRDGIASRVTGPSCELLGWKAPSGGRDLLFFVGEAQPNQRGLDFCRHLLEKAMEYGVERVVTFAAMATQVHPASDPRVFAAVNRPALLHELDAVDVNILGEGQIAGLNGVMLAAAADCGLDAVCLLGEMPFFAVTVPNPKASLRVLEIFSDMTDLELDLTELQDQAHQMERGLVDLIEKARSADDEEGIDLPRSPLDGPADAFPSDDALSRSDQIRIEKMFVRARQNRGEAVQLKNELDRLGVFQDYEDRFLDLFKSGE